MGGIPMDNAAVMSTALEGILYGEYGNSIVCPMTTKLRFLRFLSAHVYRYHLVIGP